MKFSKLYKLFLLAAVSFFGIAAIQSPTGAPAGSTGAPGENTCADARCHGGTPNSGTGTMTILADSGVDITKYVPGRKYDLTFRTEQAGIPKFGIQLTALDANNKKAGTLAKVGTDLRLLTGTKEYLTHTGNGNTVSNAKDWKFSWTAPAKSVGPVTIYVAWMASNNNGSERGDQVYTTSLTLNPDLTAVESRNLPENWSLAPNPSEGDFNLRFDMTQPQPVELTVVNTSGQLVLVKNWTNPGNTFNENISLSHLAKGVYMAQVKVGEKQYVERIMVK